MAPDEPLHICRSYQLSAFSLKPTAHIPKSIVDFCNQYTRMAFNPDKKTTINEIKSSFYEKLNPLNLSDPLVKTSLTLPYFPQSIGIFIGRMFQSPPILLMYLGRISNLLFSAFLLYFAVKAFPFNKFIIFLLVLFPLTIQQICSISSDSLTISLSILWISLVFKYIFEKEAKLNSKSILIFLGVMALLSFCKEGYALISFMTLLIPQNKFSTIRKKWLVSIICIVISLAPLILPQLANLLLSNNSIEMTHQSLASIEQQSQQKHFIFSHPIHYAITYIISEIYYFLFSWKLGWLDTILSPCYLIFYFIIFISVSIVSLPNENFKINIFQRVFIGSNLFIINLLQMTGMYIVWSSYFEIGGYLILGWQDRYLLPILLLIVPVLKLNITKSNKTINVFLIIIAQAMILFSYLYTMLALFHRYYIA